MVTKISDARVDCEGKSSLGGCEFLAAGSAVVGYGRRMIREITSVVESKLWAVKRSWNGLTTLTSAARLEDRQ